MRKLVLALLLVMGSSPAFADLTCWYDENGRSTGADSPPPWTQHIPVGQAEQLRPSGDYAWAYNIRNNESCPRTLPGGVNQVSDAPVAFDFCPCFSVSSLVSLCSGRYPSYVTSISAYGEWTAGYLFCETTPPLAQEYSFELMDNGGWNCSPNQGRQGGAYTNIQNPGDQTSCQYQLETAAYQLGVVAVEQGPGVAPDPDPGIGPDFSLEPAFGSADLMASFAPDPYTVEIYAGGSVDTLTALNDCAAGMIAEAPDFRVHYTAGSFPLTFSVTSQADTTLVINDPQGNWVCNDDSDQLNPMVTFRRPSTGQYDIWVGTWGEDNPQGMLAITER